ncbi:unnamed protein product [Angiostrongylus costaricensis]|uniref:Pecanex-like protein n=1 Tax=Angiostrongylus costaricensis TaxID=334426 RepID=A0A0R3PK38_ANGCS|nr:unnamed protein product [Angiostrongylus costaricensis]
MVGKNCNPTVSESGADIKLEITKFLEELIEKHPETLDVIENVRQSRLGRNSANRVPHMLRMHGVRSRRRSSSSSVSALSDMALRDGTHVASGHEDTSQGAVHSFQDSDGMWWTYAFDEHGVGTAQPLGSGRALMELLQSAQDPPVLPESAYVSSEDEAEPCSSRTAANLPTLNVGNTRRERALSSSSNESYTYIPQLPTTVFHAPTGTGATRTNTRREMVSFANVASRLRAAVRNSESITLNSNDLPDATSHQLSRSVMDRRDGRRDYRVLSGECPAPATHRTSTVKKSYYYKMKMFPKTNKSFKLKLDRLSVSALFDRNRSVPSCIFDVFLALYETSGEMILLAFRDLFATFLVTLPFAFTMGWLPQSLMCWALLGGLCNLAFSVDSKSTQTPAFSAFLSVAVATSYLLSRFSSNPQLFLLLCRATVFRFQKTEEWTTRNGLCCILPNEQDESDHMRDTDELDVSDPLPGRLRSAVVLRARHDVLFSTFLSLMVFALHSTSLFTATQPYFTIAKPVLHSKEYTQYESTDEAKLMTFEIIHVWMLAIEKNFLYPLVAIAMLTECGWLLPVARMLGPLIILRFLRGGFSHPQLIYMPLALAFTISHFDWNAGPPFGLSKLPLATLFPIVLYVLIVLYPKWLELYLKMSFVMAYVAPWQISWGSAFHAFAQPFSIPHSALIWTQTVLSSLLSAPLNPFLGSSFFITSYVRPVKFWERDYNTKRSDASNTTLASQIDRGPMLDDSNLNAVFYEHLTRSLQKSLAGDLQMGRWSTSVQPGDCFILASFYLNCLVHIIEVGNGFVTFQLRGLEFRGTYCHQREVEAISDDQSQGTGCCCCAPGSLPGLLSLNTAWSLRWLAWEVVTGKYIIDGYSITDNSAVNLLQVHELRRLLVTLYVKCIVYYTLASSKLQNWLANDTVVRIRGISRTSFTEWYSSWVSHCINKRLERNSEEMINSDYVTCLCYVLSLLGRRALGAASYNRHSNAAESFLCGLHALFKGDFRCVIAPAVKMALKLHQDHFAAPDDFEDPESLFNLIAEYQTKLFISHEHDPAWRRAIIANTPSLLALRHMYDEGQDDYKIIMLNRMHLNMRVIKLNRECVRAFWAGQQQELIFLRNRNPERGSIQNARQVLRNMINSSADQPVGYPIYVSPLTTSFVETHSQMANIVGPPLTIEGIFSGARRTWLALRAHFGPSGSSSFGLRGGCGPVVPTIALQQLSAIQSTQKSENSIVHMTPDGGARVALARRIPGSSDTSPGANKFSSTDPVLQVVPKKASVDKKPEQRENAEEGEELEEFRDAGLWVRINDLEQISGRNSWCCQPTEGLIGRVIFSWHPNHPNRKFRSHIGDAIYLVASPEMSRTLVPVSEKGCTTLTPEQVLELQSGENRKVLMFILFVVLFKE